MTKRMDGEPMRYGAGFCDPNAFTIKTKVILRRLHGTPTEFVAVMERAADNLEITTPECDAAIAKYNAEYEAAPDE